MLDTCTCKVFDAPGEIVPQFKLAGETETPTPATCPLFWTVNSDVSSDAETLVSSAAAKTKTTANVFLSTMHHLLQE